VLLCAALLTFGGCTLVPHPLNDADRLAEADADRQEMFGDQEPLRHPLTLREAFARALKYNLDARVKTMEEALAQNDLDLSRYDLLPKAYLNAAYTTRNNVDASSSQAIATGQQSLVPSTSNDINQTTADLSVSWNILDFGVSYLGARQHANQVLISYEERRKVAETLFQDVRRAFWRAASAQRLSREIADAIRAAEAALPAARKVETEGLRSPVDSLRYQKALLDLIKQLEGAQAVLAVSKTELAQLINLPPGQSYTIAVPGDLRIQSLRMPAAQMEETALLLNPEIREASYEKRITVDETHRAMLRLLPGINLVYDPNYDSNSFLVNHWWTTGAARLGGYMTNLLQAPATYQRSITAEHLADLKREAMSMAVLAKLHIAYQQYVSASREFRRAQQLADVDRRLYDQLRNREATDVGGDLERISQQVSAVFSQLQRYQSYAETQAALGRMYATLGIDPLPEEADQLDIAGLSRALARAMAEREQSRQPPASEPYEAAPWWQWWRSRPSAQIDPVVPVAQAQGPDRPSSATAVQASATAASARPLAIAPGSAPDEPVPDSVADIE
jgi:outer membrane protein TolC